MWCELPNQRLLKCRVLEKSSRLGLLIKVMVVSTAEGNRIVIARMVAARPSQVAHTVDVNSVPVGTADANMVAASTVAVMDAMAVAIRTAEPWPNTSAASLDTSSRRELAEQVFHSPGSIHESIHRTRTTSISVMDRPGELRGTAFRCQCHSHRPLVMLTTTGGVHHPAG